MIERKNRKEEQGGARWWGGGGGGGGEGQVDIILSGTSCCRLRYKCQPGKPLVSNTDVIYMYTICITELVKSNYRYTVIYYPTAANTVQITVQIYSDIVQVFVQ